jgi:hypothetical protein
MNNMICSKLPQQTSHLLLVPKQYSVELRLVSSTGGSGAVEGFLRRMCLPGAGLRLKIRNVQNQRMHAVFTDKEGLGVWCVPNGTYSLEYNSKESDVHVHVSLSTFALGSSPKVGRDRALILSPKSGANLAGRDNVSNPSPTTGAICSGKGSPSPSDSDSDLDESGLWNSSKHSDFEDFDDAPAITPDAVATNCMPIPAHNNNLTESSESHALMEDISEVRSGVNGNAEEVSFTSDISFTVMNEPLQLSVPFEILQHRVEVVIRKSALRIVSFLRAFLSRKTFLATLVQAKCRCCIAKRQFREDMKAVVEIQGGIRLWHAQRKASVHRKRRDCAVSIQKMLRGQQTREYVLKQVYTWNLSAIRIQALARGWYARAWRQHTLTKLLVCQSIFRQWQVKNNMYSLRREKEKQMRAVAILILERKVAARRIQRLVRQTSVRLALLHSQKATLIQHWSRRTLTQKVMKATKLKKSPITIQVKLFASSGGHNSNMCLCFYDMAWSLTYVSLFSNDSYLDACCDSKQRESCSPVDGGKS